VSDHFDGVRFFVPGHSSDRNLRQMLRWQFSGKRAPWPALFPSPFAGAVPPRRVAGLRITLVGHASFLIQVAGLNLLVDPVWAERASPLSFMGPKRVNPPGVAFDDLPDIDAVLITHNHYDHMELATIGRLWSRFRPRFVAPLGNDTIIRAAHPDIAVDVLDWGESLALGPVQAVLAPALHWSARGVRDRRMALWGAFVLRTPQGVIYHVGDTGFGDGGLFADVQRSHGAPRVAMLPIGAYEPRWFMAGQHMNPAEAVRALRMCGARTALGHHWGTFQLTDEAIEAPARALAAEGVDDAVFPAMRPGQAWGSGA